MVEPFAGWVHCFFFFPPLFISDRHISPLCSRFPCYFHSCTHRLHMSTGKFFWCASGKPTISGESERDAFRTLPTPAGWLQVQCLWDWCGSPMCQHVALTARPSSRPLVFFPFLKMPFGGVANADKHFFFQHGFTQLHADSLSSGSTALLKITKASFLFKVTWFEFWFVFHNLHALCCGF